jgi:ABC-type glycerol-3-phosphate transport system permease component
MSSMPVRAFNSACRRELESGFAHVVLSSLPLILVCVVLRRRVSVGLTEGDATG